MTRSALAELAIAEKDFATARAYAERLLDDVQRVEAPPAYQFEALFVLARALGPDPAQRDRARSLALKARDTAATVSTVRPEDLAELEQWLAEHPAR